MKKSVKWILLAGIFFIAIFIRVYQLGSIPNSLHNDEVANTYAGRFILQNGKDMFGNKIPLLYLNKFGDYPPVIPMYISGLGTYIFGVNEFGSRIGIALCGALFVIPFFFLSYMIYGNLVTVSVLTFIASILPWHVILSRSNAEGIFALTVFLYGLTFLFLYIRKNKTIFVIIGSLLMFLTYLLYPSYRIFIPTAFCSIAISCFLTKNGRKQSVVFGFLALISVVATLYISTTTWGRGRFNQTSIFTELSGVSIQINELSFNESNVVVARIFNNKVLGYSRKFIEQYLSYFSPEFLFIKGGNAQVYSVPNTGLLFLSFLLLPFLVCFCKKKTDYDKNLFKISFLLLLASPLAAALTIVETPNIHRSLSMSVFFVLLLGIYIKPLLQNKNRIMLIIFGCILSLEIVLFMHNYFQHVSLIQSVYRNDGNKAAVLYISKNKENYANIYVTNQEAWLPLTYLFYAQDFSPKRIGTFGLNFRIPQIDTVFFPDTKCPMDNFTQETDSKNYLFIAPEDCKVNKRQFTEIDSIKRINGTVVFAVYTFSRKK